jgi:hypothetical protein
MVKQSVPSEILFFGIKLYPAKAWERIAALGFATGMVVVLAIALHLSPYDPATGEPFTQGTHTQLGLPPCNFLVISGFPCPSCGMTTSFSLLMHGDVVGSWRANGAGLLLALMGLVAIPWCLLAGLGGKLWWFTSLETGLLTGLFIALVSALGRWLLVSGAILWARMGGMP